MNALQFQKNLLGMQANMMNFALTLTSNKEDARDLTQETTLKVLNNRDKFTDDVNFKGWVLTIMRNIFINNYHKMIRSQTMIDYKSDLYNLDTVMESGIDMPDNNFSLREILLAIDRLSTDLRHPFKLYLIGYKYNEISNMLDLPIGTVKSRIYFARQALRYVLREYSESL